MLLFFTYVLVGEWIGSWAMSGIQMANVAEWLD
jgi:hypothetical protein